MRSIIRIRLLITHLKHSCASIRHKSASEQMNTQMQRRNQTMIWMYINVSCVDCVLCVLYVVYMSINVMATKQPSKQASKQKHSKF